MPRHPQSRPRHPAHRPGPRGFTLIEVMIAVAIVAILVAVAMPSYRNYIIRGHLTDAVNGLAAVRADMERHYQDNRSYATVGTFTTPCASSNAATRTFNNFVVSCSGTPTATAYTLQAVGTGPVNGFTFTVNQADARATTAAPAGWGTSTSCWVLRKGATC